MSKTINIAALAGLVAMLAGPALASDDDAESLLRDSGRYVAEAAITSGQSTVFIASKHTQTRQVKPTTQGYDFQLDGR